MAAWRGLTPAHLQRLFADPPEILAAVQAWIDAHPDPEPTPTPEAS